MKKRSNWKWSWERRSSLAAIALLAGVLAPAAPGNQLDGSLRLNGSQVLEAFEPLRAVLQQSSVVMYDGRKRVEYGTLISSDGYFLTKASELENIANLSVRIDRTHYKEVQVVAKTTDWDLALLKVDAKDLVPVKWAENEPSHGAWVVSNGSSSRFRRRVRIGIISANAREVGGSAPVVLGVTLNGEDERMVIKGVQEDSGAAKAGIEKGDVLLSADGAEVKKIDDLKKVLSTKEPGNKVKLKVMRGEEEKVFDVELMAREDIFKAEKTRNDQMSGRYSKRRSNFKRVLQHDVKLSERGTGGPLLDLDGRCVGVNIARVNRSESFAIPAAEAQQVAADLLKEAGVEVEADSATAP